MTDLRKLANGRECTVRVPFCCNGNPETVVLCHYRLLGLSGMGIKSPNWCGAYACSACHSAIDSGSANFSRDELNLMHAEGVLRTLAILESEGVKPW